MGREGPGANDVEDGREEAFCQPRPSDGVSSAHGGEAGFSVRCSVAARSASAASVAVPSSSSGPREASRDRGCGPCVRRPLTALDDLGRVPHRCPLGGKGTRPGRGGGIAGRQFVRCRGAPAGSDHVAKHLCDAPGQGRAAFAAVRAVRPSPRPRRPDGPTRPASARSAEVVRSPSRPHSARSVVVRAARPWDGVAVSTRAKGRARMPCGSLLGGVGGPHQDAERPTTALAMPATRPVGRVGLVGPGAGTECRVERTGQ